MVDNIEEVLLYINGRYNIFYNGNIIKLYNHMSYVSGREVMFITTKILNKNFFGMLDVSTEKCIYYILE